ncbi:hypothetical protein JAAARDRAFT_122109 [Jaapia argillacea MUCL 33604]|uniref:Hydrophobin n=1 Tax=Jaapia argillacea MUCL 33604 TaxID=933084 RepID=A0A067QJG5_9AGAM|nr:hypothetical protein JAAARDRAFT_122109 [Jaapia argillacea MUCL 33604]
MIPHIATFFATLFAYIFLAAAYPTQSSPRTSEPASQCTTGPIQCCQSVSTAGAEPAAALLGLLDVVVQDLNVLVGVTCSPITVVGVGDGSSCIAHPVCCTDNSYGGLVSIGCVPVEL